MDQNNELEFRFWLFSEEPAKKSWSVDKKLKINRLSKKKNQGQQGSFQKEEPANTGSNLQKSI
jgi:hypothetical protein